MCVEHLGVRDEGIVQCHPTMPKECFNVHSICKWFALVLLSTTVHLKCDAMQPGELTDKLAI